GACRREVDNCLDGHPQRCTPGAPAAEACNGEDDDCDGTIDEGAGATTCGVGACVRRAECVDGVEDACVPGEPGVEVCNDADEDCDGRNDEDFLGEVVVTQYSTLWTYHEVCDGNRQRIGPDCNAAMNRFCNARPCRATGFGPVENSGDTSVVTCLSGVTAERVTYATLAAHHDVCDGNRERIGPACNAAIHRWCASRGFVSGFGPVESGPDFVFAVCVGPRAEVRGVTYAALSAQHGPCDGNGQRIGPDCNAAIHRWCRSQGFTSGYGPVENSGGDAAVTCVRQ
ncbi:MAG: hypothetical protein KC620_19000, partial [Myxococcales bacterium]|nr:hypothetical protein [Myxococcales bacterium]